MEALIPFRGFQRNRRFRELTGSGISSLNAVSHKQRMRTIKVKIVTGVEESKDLASLKDISAIITTKRASSPPQTPAGASKKHYKFLKITFH